ncbi:transcription initiation factor TFIID subunit 6 [Rozella allomycis CSF55]|uniref:DUF1546 domain-containing protein n=1 Tax=Rozella allomycis (strain CSF55) TaxID=988480 RepID=A0A075AYV9_ROZAC|nr:DUF1546 domain-containing protein [Rozella allomycis CSF55]RKP20846.1 transcription initiation factor TFIID subunit 6 [Rozella allomycis CSF55]|eukprot:EPZ33902.1 DUF1546 domain-containing protein [Rozella allomycis CSF55]
MTLLSPQSIKIYAETIGISNLSEEVTQLVAQDVEYRLREIIQEAAKFMNHAKRSLLTTADVNDSLANRNYTKIYGYSSVTTSSFRPVSVGNVFYVDDQEIDFEDLLKSQLPKLPQRKRIGSHWLAVEGVQPQLPQNPQQDISNNVELSVNTTQKDIETKDLTKHALPKEQQIFFETLTHGLLKANEIEASQMLGTLRNELGLQLLLPYFIQFASEMVARYLRDLGMLGKMMRMIDALLDNKNIFIEPYLHQLMPIILTCLVGKTLCKAPNENHWSLREFSAGLVAKICNQFKTTYSTIQPRLTKTLLKIFLDPSKPLTSHYGAILGLSKLGHEVVKIMIIPHLKMYGDLLDHHMKDQRSIQHFEAGKCYKALLVNKYDVLNPRYAPRSV